MKIDLSLRRRHLKDTCSGESSAFFLTVLKSLKNEASLKGCADNDVSDCGIDCMGLQATMVSGQKQDFIVFRKRDF